MSSNSTRNPAAGSVGGGESGAAAEHRQPQAAGHSSHRGHATARTRSRRAFAATARMSSRRQTGRRTHGRGDSRAYDAPEMRSLPPLVASLARIPFFAGLDEDALERAGGRDTDPPVPSGRGHLPCRRSRRRPVHHRVRRGEDRAALGDRRRGHHREPAAGRRLRRARAAGRRGTIGHGVGARGHGGRRPATRPIPRADRHRAGGPGRPAGVAGRRAATPHASTSRSSTSST